MIQKGRVQSRFTFFILMLYINVYIFANLIYHRPNILAKIGLSNSSFSNLSWNFYPLSSNSTSLTIFAPRDKYIFYEPMWEVLKIKLLNP